MTYQRLGRPAGKGLMAIAVVLLSFNLRPAVNALGVAIPELQADTGLSDTVAGVLLALPTLCFAIAGFAVSAIAARIGSQWAVLLSLLLVASGQLLRAAVPGTGMLFAGSILALIGIPIGNVLLPGLIRQHFPAAIGPMTALYTTVLMIGQTAGAGVTLPLEHALGGDWRVGIGLWAAPALLAILPWIAVVVRREPRPAAGQGVDEREEQQTAPEGTAHEPAIAIGALMRSPRAWSMAVFFGVQSLHAYVMFGWLPSVLTAGGVSTVTAGTAMAILTGVGIPIAAIIPTLATRAQRPFVLVIAIGVTLLLGYGGLILAPASWPLGFAFLIGLGIGSSFPLGLTLLALRSRTSRGTNALSTFSQAAGYLIASIGPFGFGVIHDLTHSWSTAVIMLLLTVIPLLISGRVVVRQWHVEDEIRQPAEG